MLKKLVVVIIFLALLFGGAGFSGAQERSYSYDAIKFEFKVNPDTTIDVVERQTYRFNGQYHNGWREIPLRGVSAITDVQVVDAATNQPIPFTVSRENGSQNIKWSYDLADTTHEWILKYKLHGALAFYSDHDELYWNLFTSYTVPVAFAEATVILPENQFDRLDLRLTAYGDPVPAVISQIIGNTHFYLSASNLPAGEKLTIAAGWPLGLVDHSAFWKDWLWLNLLYLLSALLVLGAVIYSLVRWYVLEYKPEHSRTIVPEYAPPRNLKPAMVEVIVKEGIGNKTWAATIVDLAIRGHVKIEEIEKNNWFVRMFTTKDYRLIRLEGGSLELENYERDFIDVIFDSKSEVTTKELMARARGSIEGSFFRMKMRKLKETLYVEIGMDVKDAYAVEISKLKKKQLLWVLIFVLIFLLFFVLSSIISNPKVGIFIIAAVISSLALYSLRYEPRLSPEGMQLKREILGFKLYLKTAERYRLQNLTPNLFEKFLPYAIIFGVEKKWAKAFEGMSVPPPSWYHGAGAVSAGSGSFSSNSFSAPAFSASFSSSFASAFSSSAGGGASGGGGGAS